jgi:hypothetical protein
VFTLTSPLIVSFISLPLFSPPVLCTLCLSSSSPSPCVPTRSQLLGYLANTLYFMSDTILLVVRMRRACAGVAISTYDIINISLQCSGYASMLVPARLK